MALLLGGSQRPLQHFRSRRNVTRPKNFGQLIPQRLLNRQSLHFGHGRFDRVRIRLEVDVAILPNGIPRLGTASFGLPQASRVRHSS